MLKKFAIALAGFIAVVVILGAVKAAQIKEMSSMDHSMPLLSVATTEVQAVNWRPTLKAIGTLASVEGVTIAADADGTITRIAVESGAPVRAGDLLVAIDTSVEEANLKAAQATAELNRINLERAKDLWARQAMAKSDYDAAAAAAEQSRAAVAALEAQIAKKQVRAPFDGRAGIRHVNVGQFVARGAALMPLQKLDPIYLNFNIPQRQLPALAIGQTIAVAVDAFDRAFEGRVTAINTEVDASTRNVAVQATLANPDELLRPGMFARVEVQLPTADVLMVVPATAIAYASYGNSVFVVETMKDPAGKEYLGVRQQFVQLGATRGDLVAVTGGLKPGEQVVSAGVFKLRNGAAVQVNNTAQPTSNPSPKPANT
jgi:membrane fusion protein (multidrug efflux system)